MAVAKFSLTSNVLLLQKNSSNALHVTELPSVEVLSPVSCSFAQRGFVLAHSFPTLGGGHNCLQSTAACSSPNSRHRSSGSFGSSFFCKKVSSESQLCFKQLRKLAIASRAPCVCAAGGATAINSEIESSTNLSLYGLLGVPEDVGLPEIKSAFRKMALKYHPDVCSPTTQELSTKMFLEVQHAYEVLSDPALRADYDYVLMHPSFAQAFERSEGRIHRRPPPRKHAGNNHSREDNGVSEAWKLQWEAQLTRLKHKKREQRETVNPFTTESWGSRMRRQPRPQTAAFVWDLLSSKSSIYPPKWCSLQKQILDGPQELMGRAQSPLRGADTMLNTLIVKTVTLGSRLVQGVRTEKGDQSLSGSTNIVGQKQSSRT